MKTKIGCCVCDKGYDVITLSCAVLLYKPDRFLKKDSRPGIVCRGRGRTDVVCDVADGLIDSRKLGDYIHEPHQQKPSRSFKICRSCILKAKETALVDPMAHAFINALCDAYAKLEFKD